MATLPASALRWLALVPADAGLAFAAAPARYDIFVDRDGPGAAIRGADGQLALVGKPSAFVVEQWLRADGDAQERQRCRACAQGARCDRAGCVVEPRGRRASSPSCRILAAFEEDCRRAAIVISRLEAPPTCAASLVLDRDALTERGARRSALRGPHRIRRRQSLRVRARSGPSRRLWRRRNHRSTAVSPAQDSAAITDAARSPSAILRTTIAQ